jgi:hypothetical protein
MPFVSSIRKMANEEAQNEAQMRSFEIVSKVQNK